MSVWDNYECDGQMSLNDWLSDRDKVREVGIIDLCDDPICSNCGYEFNMIEDKRYNIKKRDRLRAVPEMQM